MNRDLWFTVGRTIFWGLLTLACGMRTVEAASSPIEDAAKKFLDDLA